MRRRPPGKYAEGVVFGNEVGDVVREIDLLFAIAGEERWYDGEEQEEETPEEEEESGRKNASRRRDDDVNTPGGPAAASRRYRVRATGRVRAVVNDAPGEPLVFALNRFHVGYRTATNDGEQQQRRPPDGKWRVSIVTLASR